MINLDGLVLGPCMGVWAKPITVTPTVSQPLAQPYAARGIWEASTVKIVTEDGGQLSTRNITIGIRLSEFAYAPMQGDWITVQASDLPLSYWQGEVDPTSSIDWIVDDVNPDGQGGSKLSLKRVIS